MEQNVLNERTLTEKTANFGSVICVKRKSVYHGDVLKSVMSDGVAIFRKMIITKRF